MKVNGRGHHCLSQTALTYGALCDESMFHIYTVNYGSYLESVLIEHLKCTWCNPVTKLDILFTFN